MTTGNLRRAAEGLFADDVTSRRQARVFTIISMTFGIGAFLGGIVTPHLANTAVVVPILMLVAAIFWSTRR